MQTDRDHPKNTMEMKSTASYPPLPPYSATTPNPGPQPYSGYPHPASSATANHPVAPLTTEIGFREVYTVQDNSEPSPTVLDDKAVPKRTGSECCWKFVQILSFAILIACVTMVLRMLLGYLFLR